MSQMDSSTSIARTRETTLAWQKRNREHLREYNRQWRAARRPEQAAYWREWRAKRKKATNRGAPVSNRAPPMVAAFKFTRTGRVYWTRID